MPFIVSCRYVGEIALGAHTEYKVQIIRYIRVVPNDDLHVAWKQFFSKYYDILKVPRQVGEGLGFDAKRGGGSFKTADGFIHVQPR
ncbi:MAG TPA: hypothetical protein VF278_12580 [Pirellulales bacterium]